MIDGINEMDIIKRDQNSEWYKLIIPFDQREKEKLIIPLAWWSWFPNWVNGCERVTTENGLCFELLHAPKIARVQTGLEVF